MPAIAKTSDIDVISAARRIIAENGIDGLSMQGIGDAVGIKAPSLYKRFSDRSAIIRGVQLTEFAEIGNTIEESVADLSPADAIRKIAEIQWSLSQERPKIYAILFSVGTITNTEDIAIRTQALTPLFVACRALVGPGTGLAAARTLASYIHGFISMQMSGAFDQTPGVEGSYYFGLNAIIKGMVS
jgi:AcrR family transcriptional regulator